MMFISLFELKKKKSPWDRHGESRIQGLLNYFYMLVIK